jgi:hypothetical protein
LGFALEQAMKMTSPDVRVGQPASALELGIFLGAKNFGDVRQPSKECIVFDRDRFRYQKYISDVAGQDIATHNNNPKVLVGCLRDWLAVNTTTPLPDGQILWDRYQHFHAELAWSCRRVRQNADRLTFVEYLRYVDQFRRTTV